MNQTKIIFAAIFGFAFVLLAGCQNTKPVGPIQSVSVKVSISAKNLLKADALELPYQVIEVLYRINGPSMNPVSGAVTVSGSQSEPGLAIEPRFLFSDNVNLTVNVPAGSSRVLAVELKGSPAILAQDNLYDPNKETLGIGAVEFDIDPGTLLVNVPVIIGPMNHGYKCFAPQEHCYDWVGSVAYMGNTDLVNCASVPNPDAFRPNLCEAKGSDTINAGDVFCVSLPVKGAAPGHVWVQYIHGFGDTLCPISRTNYEKPYYAVEELPAD